MSITVNDLERTVNSSLTTSIIKSEINYGQLFIDIDYENLSSTILFLKTNEKCKFKQLIDITAVDYPEREKRFKIIYLLLSHENNLRIVINLNISEKIQIPIFMWDERLSTVGAFNLSSQLDINVSKRVKNIDENAATFILQGVLDYLNN